MKLDHDITYFWKCRCLAPLSLAEHGDRTLSVGDTMDLTNGEISLPTRAASNFTYAIPLRPPNNPFFCRNVGAPPEAAAGWAVWRSRISFRHWSQSQKSEIHSPLDACMGPLVLSDMFVLRLAWIDFGCC